MVIWTWDASLAQVTVILSITSSVKTKVLYTSHERITPDMPDTRETIYGVKQ